MNVVSLEAIVREEYGWSRYGVHVVRTFAPRLLLEREGPAAEALAASWAEAVLGALRAAMPDLARAKGNVTKVDIINRAILKMAPLWAQERLPPPEHFCAGRVDARWDADAR